MPSSSRTPSSGELTLNEMTSTMEELPFNVDCEGKLYFVYYKAFGWFRKTYCIVVTSQDDPEDIRYAKFDIHQAMRWLLGANRMLKGYSNRLLHREMHAFFTSHPEEHGIELYPERLWFYIGQFTDMQIFLKKYTTR
ncbi:hypothetical protein PCE1_001235 [Barthelona sp. PCE]